MSTGKEESKEEKIVAGECEGADIEKTEKLYPKRVETSPKPETETSVIISDTDLQEYKGLCDSDAAWEELVKAHNSNLMEKQKVITSSIKEFWRKLAVTYRLDLTKSFAISNVTGEIKEVPKIQKGEGTNG